MRSTLCLVTFSLAIVVHAGTVQAQHHATTSTNNNSHPQAFQMTYPGAAFNGVPGGGYGGITFPSNNITFPYNGLTFPSNNITFPYNGLTFPSNNITFPYNGLTFPTYAPGNAVSNAPNFNTNNAAGYFQNGTGFYGSYVSNGNQRKVSQTNINPALVTGFGAGLGSIVAGPTQHYTYTMNNGYSGYNRIRPVYHTVHTYQPRNNGPQITPAERHFNSMVQDLDALTPQFHAVDYHRNMIRNDILGLVSGTDRPPTATVQQLANHLTNAMVARSSQPIDTTMIASELRTLVNGGNYTQTEIKQAISQTEQALRQGGIRNADLKNVTTAMNGVASHFQSFSTPTNTGKSATASKSNDADSTVKPAPVTEVKSDDSILDKLKDKSIIPPGDK